MRHSLNITTVPMNLTAVMQQKQSSRMKRRTKEIKQEHMLQLRESFSRKIPLLQRLCDQKFLSEEQPIRPLLTCSDELTRWAADESTKRDRSSRSTGRCRKQRKHEKKTESKSELSLIYGKSPSSKKVHTQSWRQTSSKPLLRISFKKKGHFHIHSKTVSLDPDYRKTEEESNA